MKLIIIALSLIIVSLSQADDIVKNELDIQPDGHYTYSYETQDGIVVAQSGVGGESISGHADWKAPDGSPVHLAYTADEHGYFPSGDGIHPQLIKALEYIKSHPVSKRSPEPYRWDGSAN